MKNKKGILLVNLGTPNAPTRGSVYKYLKQFLLDPRVIDIAWLPRNLLVRGIIAPFRSGASAKLYQQLWTEEGSPLKVYGKRVEKLLQDSLGEDYVVKLAMRYQRPSIMSGIKYLLDKKVNEIIVFPMFPQYASATTGSVHEEVMRCIKGEQSIPNLKFINSYYDNEQVIGIYADNALKMGIENYDHFIFSFHGIPQRQLIKADRCNHCLKQEDCCQSIAEHNQFCYSAQCYATAFAIAKRMGLEPNDYTVAFQSRLGKDPWTQPYTSTVIEDMAKNDKKKLLVFSPAFVADCLETTIEIGVEYQEEFEEFGGEKIDLVPSLNEDPRWVAAIKQIVTEA